MIQRQETQPAMQMGHLWLVQWLLWTSCLSAAAQQVPREVGWFDQEVAQHFQRQVGLPAADVRAVVLAPDGGVVADTAAGSARWRDGAWRPVETSSSAVPIDLPAGMLRQWTTVPQGTQAAATTAGLFERREGGTWQQLMVRDGLGRIWAAEDVRGVAYDAASELWFASRAGVGHRTEPGWRFYEGKDGLPYNDFTCCAASADGSVWFGTHKGAIRYRAGRWAYRQGPRWLPDDDVRSIVADGDGTVWFATAGGVGCIEQQRMSLAQKAAIYEQEIDQRIKRTPYGYVAEAHLQQPGDKTTAGQHDSDNDGLWTAMYGASQCFAYAVDGSEAARRRAKQAFEALRFLQTVTQGGPHSPPRGYVARTVLPANGPDPNQGRIDADRRMQAERDRLWKVYEPRWPKSAGGEWYWKSDTSSDELDGHYFFHALYYDLVADTDAEKQRVRQVVRELTDHLIDHGFALVDHDGRPTRWGDFRPESLNQDSDWWTERGLNSLSMLSYLSVARHMTGEARYQQAAERLMREHGYHMNVMVPKVQRGMGSGNQSDDEMAFMSLHNLVKYTPDGPLRQQFLAAFYWYWTLEQPERNPFFDFCYAAFGRGQTFRDPFGSEDLSPAGDWLTDALDTLIGFPLDRINWAHANSHRLDLVLLPAQQGPGTLDANRGGRGYRVDGKVLPVEERFFAHWNTDPWRLDYAGDGRTLASGAVYLLPYYMGRYYGLIQDTTVAAE